ncbi:hypothetical protein [Streptomyces sp. CBMA156]|uniref:hypothetical protein n=1 Tax=Streptomyces sp. CBMA156 TaxID=1930280 RepID=UPI0016620115|nr:hypothetical protein [Streptomyces sp. CBMA156]
MDSGVRAMVDAVDEARRQLRENALPKARDSGRDKVPESEEAVLLAALAGLVEAVVELADAASDRMATGDSRETYVKVARRLRDQPGYLRDDAAAVARRVRGPR